MRIFKLSFILGLSFLLNHNANATPFLISSCDETYQLSNADNLFEEYVDTSNSLSFADIIKPENAIPFTNVHLGKKFIDAQNTHWYKLDVQNETSCAWIIGNGDPAVEKMELYQVVNGKVIKQVSGKLENFSNRTFRSYSPMFELFTERGQTQTLYLKIASKNAFAYGFTISPLKKEINENIGNNYFHGLFYGVFFIMAIYSLLQFILTREKIFLLYTGFIISHTGFQLSRNFGPILFWRAFPAFNEYSTLVFLNLVVIMLRLYVLSFLSISPKEKFVKWLDACIAAYLIFSVVEHFFFKGILIYPDLHTIFTPFLLAVAIQKYRLGNGAARFIIAGISFIFIGQIFFIIAGFDLEGTNVYTTVYSLYICHTLEILMFSIATGDRYKQLKAHRDTINKKLIWQMKENEELQIKLNIELENLVEERTLQLQNAYSLLNEHNIELEKDIKDISKEITFQGLLSFEDFGKSFPDEDFCLQFLADLKWSKGFVCKKCKNDRYTNVSVLLTRKCLKCKYAETPMAYTIFHSIKSPLNKAFYMLYFYYARKGKVTSVELANLLQMRQRTCWEILNRFKSHDLLRHNQKITSVEGWVSWILVDNI